MNLSGYRDTVAAIYADDRLRADQRVRAGVPALALALAWLYYCEPPSARGTYGRRLSEIMGGSDRARTAIAADLPCYSPPRTSHMHGTQCRAPMVRRDGPCGENPQWSYRHVYPKSGQWFRAGYCTRHRQVGEAACAENRADLATLDRIPEPVPNHGGILPGLMPGWEWEQMYSYVRKDWTPPAYGIVADHWPQVAALHGKPKLTVMPGANEIVVVDAPPVEPPVLRIVRDSEVSR